MLATGATVRTGDYADARRVAGWSFFQVLAPEERAAATMMDGRKRGGIMSADRLSSEDAVTADPAELDPDFPPTLQFCHFPSEGETVHGAVYVAQGAETKGCLLLMPEMGGYDRLASLFNPVLNSGINIAYIYPRGMWDGSTPYSFVGALTDLHNAARFFRSREAAARFRIDPDRLCLGGLSGGGGVLSLIACAEDRSLSHAMAVATADFGSVKAEWLPAAAFQMKEATHGRIDADLLLRTMTDEDRRRLSLIGRAAELRDKVMLIVHGARDEVNPVELSHKPIVSALRAAGARRLTDVILDSDHHLLTKRIALARLTINWLRQECGF